MWTMTAYDYGSITQSPTSSVPYGRFDGLLHIFLYLLHTINNEKTAIVVILAILEGPVLPSSHTSTAISVDFQQNF